MHLVTKRSVIQGARDRWLTQYKGYSDAHSMAWGARRPASEIRAALHALDLDTCSEADLDAAIGVSGWAELSCDECKQPSDALVQFGEEPDYEARWVLICEQCLRTGLEKLKP